MRGLLAFIWIGCLLQIIKIGCWSQQAGLAISEPLGANRQLKPMTATRLLLDPIIIWWDSIAVELAQQRISLVDRRKTSRAAQHQSNSSVFRGWAAVRRSAGQNEVGNISRRSNISPIAACYLRELWDSIYNVYIYITYTDTPSTFAVS